MTQHKQSHRIKSHGRTSHQPTLHQNRSHHHHGTAEGSFTAKTWFGHRAGRSPCAHSIGKFFLCYMFFFLVKLPPPARPGTTCKIIIYTWVFPKIKVPQIIHFNRVLPYKPTILGVLPLFLEGHPLIHGVYWGYNPPRSNILNPRMAQMIFRFSFFRVIF